MCKAGKWLLKESDIAFTSLHHGEAAKIEVLEQRYGDTERLEKMANKRTKGYYFRPEAPLPASYDYKSDHLRDACKKNQIDLVKRLLPYYKSTKAHLLDAAFKHNRLEIFELILSHCNKKDLYKENFNGSYLFNTVYNSTYYSNYPKPLPLTKEYVKMAELLLPYCPPEYLALKLSEACSKNKKWLIMLLAKNDITVEAEHVKMISDKKLKKYLLLKYFSQKLEEACRKNNKRVVEELVRKGIKAEPKHFLATKSQEIKKCLSCTKNSEQDFEERTELVKSDNDIIKQSNMKINSQNQSFSIPRTFLFS